jgi:hypothetical protein
VGTVTSGKSPGYLDACNYQSHRVNRHPLMPLSARSCRFEGGSVEKVEVLASRLHGVDQQLVATVKAKHHDLEQAASRVEPEAQLTCRAVFVQVDDKNGMLGGMDGVIRINSVPMRGVVDPHAT